MAVFAVSWVSEKIIMKVCAVSLVSTRIIIVYAVFSVSIGAIMTMSVECMRILSEYNDYYVCMQCLGLIQGSL